MRVDLFSNGPEQRASEPPRYEVVVDSFAGGGGASTGIEMALGRSPDFAINHDAEALALHRANHPCTVHLSRNIYRVDPIDVVGRRPVGLAWFSPDCKHFSKAKGGRPVKRNIRDLAWVVVTWAKRSRPRVIILENVEEFRTWGPVVPDGKGGYRPCPDRVGQTFDAWCRELRRLGYRIEWRELRACDYGAPTIRKRLFVIARRDGAPIVWPEPTHGAPDSADVIAGRKLPWRTAASIIDWSLPCPSIFDTSEEIKAKWGIRAKRPLAEATLRRIARGVVRYVLEAEKPFFVTYAQHGGRNRDPDEPLHTITASQKDYNGVVVPAVVGCGGRAGQSAPRGGGEPLGTQTTKADACLVAASMVQTGYGEREGQAPRALDVQAPVGTQVAGGAKHAVVSAFMAQHTAGSHPGRPARDVLEPVSTVTQAGSQQGLVAAHLTRFNTGATGSSLDAPVPTVTANSYIKREGGAAPLGVVAAHMMSMRGSDRRGYSAAEPMRTASAGGTHEAMVAAFLDTYYGNGEGWAVSRPMPTDTTRDRSSLVTLEIDGQTYAIADIGLRMLTPRERFRAQGFPDTYEIEHGVDEYGARIPLSQAAQGRMCGNSVCPPLAEALVRANVPELAMQREVAG
jgi:DNA (cytosine-5)-methyltransferase 1